ncbi:MAG: hypothetical protein IPL47_09130 [Phyllobacteriaceae bacterium]|nr:hypothetical protein [Phyllobacteriaceae bacterium]
MQQPSLFDSLDQPSGPRPVRPEPIRKYLGFLRRTARMADFMPWHEVDRIRHERDFPEYACHLPEGEGEALLAEFRSEMERLKAA